MERKELTLDGRRRTYTLVEGDERLLIVLHGSLQSGAVMRNFSDRTFEGLGPTVIYPDGVKRHFNDLRTGLNEAARRERVDDVAFIRELAARHGGSGVFAAGFSNGGQMVLRLLFDAPGLLHGAALFGASMPTADNTLVSTDQFEPTPIVSVQGTADPLVPYEGGEAGINDANRGETRSAVGSAEYLAQLNGCTDRSTRRDGAITVDTWSGPAPVELWSIKGFGHMIPGRTDLDERIGPGTDQVTGGEIVRGFFGL